MTLLSFSLKHLFSCRATFLQDITSPQLLHERFSPRLVSFGNFTEEDEDDEDEEEEDMVLVLVDEGEEVETKIVVCVASMNFTFLLALMVRRARSRSTWLDMRAATGLGLVLED